MSTEPASDPSPDTTEPQEPTYNYRCPLCGIEYEAELITRVHVCRSKDAAHRNYNGLMPEVEIGVIDGDEVVETLSRRPQDIDLTTLTVDDLPAEKSEQHKHILLVAARNPHESSYTELEDEVARRLKTHNLEVVSYSTIRRVIQSFYRPQKTSSSTDDKDTFAALTPKQQAIILARLEHPDKSAAEIADTVGCAPSYPPQVYTQAESVLSRLTERVETDATLAEIVHDELPEESIKDLVERRLVQDLNINLEELTDEQNTENRERWGSPIDDHEVMSADPTVDTVDESSGDRSKEPTNQEPEKPSDSDASDTSSETLVADEQSTEDTIPAEDIAALKDRVAFVGRVFAGASDPSGDIAAVVALAEQIEASCDELLNDT